MEYFCPKCEWAGHTPKTRWSEAPDMGFFPIQTCPKCHGKVYELSPKEMVYGRWYFMGSYALRWK